VNGTDAVKTDGDDGFSFGLLAPTPTDFASGDVTVTTPGTGVLPDDVYDIAITYYNSATNQQSARSETYTVTTLATNKIQVVLPTPAEIGDPQVDFVQVHIRRQSTQTVMFQIVAGMTSGGAVAGDDVAGGKGWAVDYTNPAVARTITIDMTATQLLNSFTLTPGVSDNMPPPSKAIAIAWHKSRMFAVTDTEIFWTEVGKPEAFNQLDFKLPVAPDEGDPITGLLSSNGVLIIFKAGSTHALVGDDPATWSIQVIDDDIGCPALQSAGSEDNRAWWWSLRGPRMWAGPGSKVEDITTEFIAPTVGSANVNQTYLAQIEFVSSPDEGWLGWAVPGVGATRNTFILPFNFKVNRWMSTKWDPCDICSMCTIEDAAGRKWPMLGDYAGFVYKLGSGVTDGVPTAITSPTGTVTSAGATTLTDSAGASKGWVADKLIGRYVYVWPTATGIANYQRRLILGNTTTQLTVAAWDAIPTADYTYVIGGILFDLRTGWLDPGGSFMKKRWEFVYLHVGSLDSSMDFDLNLYTDWDEDTVVRSRSISFSGGSAVWDAAVWDTDVWSKTSSLYERIRVGKASKNIQIRISNIATGQRPILYKLALQAVPRSRKLDKGA
jgi:hypothetical protein